MTATMTVPPGHDAAAGSPPQPAPLPPINVAETFDGKNILFIGTTGFVGKVALSMLLCRYPNVGKVFTLVRPGMGNTADERFFTKVVASPAFDPLREMWGDGYMSFLREKIVPIPGDIGRPLCNFTDAQFEDFARVGLDVIVNSAGLVSFTPSLESAIRINAMGAKNVLEAARKARTRLVHVSTCYVAGRRDGEVWEDEPVVGYFPRHRELTTRDFSAEREIEDCQRIIEQVRALANDRAHISHFRELAIADLEDQRRDPDDEKVLSLAIARQRKLWMHKRLMELGQERAEHWGWTNTYTYTKSLGEQVILADTEVCATVVRPAIVESAVSFPFPGWNEGFNTTAPLVYLVLKGHRQIAAGHRMPIDIIPVDMVAAGMLQATAAILVDRHKPVYQFGSSAVNPVFMSRVTELTALAVRRYYRQKVDAGEGSLQNRMRARLEAFPVSYDRFQRFSAPQLKRVANRLQDEIDRRLPRWGAPRLAAAAERAKDKLGEISDFTGQVIDLIDLFKPFTNDHDIRFRSDNTRALNQQLTIQDQQALRWNPEDIDWRYYWYETHFEGLRKWVFPVLDDEFGPKQRSVYTYRDLLELFDATTKLNKHRVALRLLSNTADQEPIVYTYQRVQELAQLGSGALRRRGVEPGDRVMLISESRPEWGISYFAVLKAGGTAVPVDSQLSLAEVVNLVRAAGARVVVASLKVAERLLEDAGVDVPVVVQSGPKATATPGSKDEVLDGPRAVAALAELLARNLGAAGHDGAVTVVGFDDLLSPAEPAAPAFSPPRLGDNVASLIYTSGTTGEPKGVMLTHKNLSAMTSKLSSLFKLYRHDGLLSVLPLHHTFEFSAGFLMPLIHGSSITYLEEVGADSLNDAFAEGNITGMIGVPALWQLLHRRIFKTASERGPLLLRAFESAIELSRKLWDKSGINFGKALFVPVHRQLGGRLRLLISGGSALDPEVMRDFQGLGFRLFEGYGMTEAAPVITVMRPEDGLSAGSVGRALPGVDVKIFEPDERGVGEVIARGPNVMAGYFQNQQATADVLKDGWLHTGDLGRMDDDGTLYIVGRKKEMILGASGENIYPDELEEVYRDSPYIKEMSIVGVPTDGSGETVAALVVPDYDHDGTSRETVREHVREHMRTISKQLPLYKRVKVFHLWDHELPRTASRKVKRRDVAAELGRLERASARAAESRREGAQAGQDGKKSQKGDATDTAWVRDVIAQVTQKGRAQVRPETKLEELGFDSLMFTELGVAVEAAGVTVPDPADLAELETVADVEAYLGKHGLDAARKPAARKGRGNDARGDDGEINVSEPLVRVGRRVLRMGQRMAYERLFTTRVSGRAYIPPMGGYIVAANHASHLDMGLVKHALGEQGDLLVALAAKDYFFDDPVRRAYFENFTNLVPMERYGSLRESLRLAGDVLRAGHILLIFPEGTRSETGIMTEFKPSLGYLALANHAGILPMYLAGTHDALPKGAYWLKKRELGASIGPFADAQAISGLAQGRSRSGSYRAVSTHIERVVRRMAPAEYRWTLGGAGTDAHADWLATQPADDRPQQPSQEEDASA